MFPETLPAVEYRPGDVVREAAVERAGMSTLNEGQKVAFEVVANRKTGKSSAENLKAA